MINSKTKDFLALLVLVVFIFVISGVIPGMSPSSHTQTAATLGTSTSKSVSRDMTPPVTSQFSISSDPKKGVLLTFTTDEGALATVSYGTGGKMDFAEKEKAYSKSHSIVLSSVQPEVEYDFSVSLMDTFGNIHTTPGSTFRWIQGGTRPMPYIYITSFSVTNIGQTAAVINWTTNVPADATVLFGSTQAYGSTLTNSSPALNHSITISPLTAAHQYHFRVKSVAASGASTMSTDRNFSTMSPPGCSTASANPYETAVYVWDYQEAYIDDVITSGSPEQTALFAYLDAKNIPRIYLNVQTNELQDTVFANNLKNFLNTAWNAHCVRVDFLDGDPLWLAYPGNPYISNPDQSYYSNGAVDWANAIKNFTASIPSGDAKPEALLADIEPHGFHVTNWTPPEYNGWDYYWNWSDAAETEHVVQAYLGMLAEMKAALAGSDLVLSANIPRWFDNTLILQGIHYGGLTRNLMQHVYPIIDEANIMDYVVQGGPCTTGGTICADALSEITLGAAIGKPSSITIETTDATGTGQTNGINSFWTMSCTDFTNALSSTYTNMSAAGKLPGFHRYGAHALWKYGTPYSGLQHLCP